MTKRFYTLRDLFPLNGAFFIEIIILTYHFFKNEILKNRNCQIFCVNSSFS